MKNPRLFTGLLAALMATAASLQAQVAIPASYAMPAGSVDTTAPGFRVRPYATDEANPNTLAWTEEQMIGLHGPNKADLSGADASGYYIVPTVNWNNSVGGTVDDLPAADDFPGLAGIAENKSAEILTYLQFPTNGVYTLGVNSDDGFVATTAALNPKDHFSGLTLGGPIDGGRGAADTL
ncbi:MAG TPA: hypothetical protein VHH73_07915, partial [Verrucomicrobiae bacterium]|nr:hypothetical protein [Verrucomicrobiae bacterium]